MPEETKPEMTIDDLPSLGENMMIVEFNYSGAIVLPVPAGIKLLEALKNARTYEDSFSEPKKIRPYESSLKTSFISMEDYKQFQLNHILGATNDAN